MVGMTWARAHTLGDFGECTALWLERKLPNIPTQCVGASCAWPHVETTALVATLAKLNRSGKFITTFSQPGCTPRSRRYGGVNQTQRAAVGGFVPPAYINEVRAHLDAGPDAELWFNATVPGAYRHDVRVAVSKQDGRSVTWAGDIVTPKKIMETYAINHHPGRVNRVVAAALEGCYRVAVVDLRWGRNDLLWPALKRLAK